MNLRQTLARDLTANTGQSGLLAFLKGILLEPAILTITLYRISAHLYNRKHNKLSKIFWRWMVGASGCYISAESEIGPGLALPHPIGIVIGTGCKLGCNVTIYQGVTLGRDTKTGLYPTVHDGVTVFTGAVILGGVFIGQSSIIGAQSLVLHDVPENSVAKGSPARV